MTAWACLLLMALHRWLPSRSIVAVADGEFAALELLHALRHSMVVIARLRYREAQLFDPPPCNGDRPGCARCKSKRHPLLSTRITDLVTRWQRVVQPCQTS